MDKISIAGVRFIVTSACNYNCSYCHNEWEDKARPVKGLEERLIDSIISSAKNLGAPEVDITGGEPLLEVERVKTILISAKKHGMWTNMTTNGFYLQKNVSDLREWGLREIHIHVPSLDPEKYRQMMRGNSNLGVVLGSVGSAAGVLDKVMINVPIENGLNEDEIPKMIEYFGDLRATPRFIESMSTKKYLPLKKETIERIIKTRFGEVEKTGEYLWGINKYSAGDYQFETLRCICFDRKCDVCHETNFLHVDKDYKVRPCNLRKTKFDITENNSREVLVDAYKYLRDKTDVPKEYNKLWGGQLL